MQEELDWLTKQIHGVAAQDAKQEFANKIEQLEKENEKLKKLNDEKEFELENLKQSMIEENNNENMNDEKPMSRHSFYQDTKTLPSQNTIELITRIEACAEVLSRMGGGGQSQVKYKYNNIY